MLSNISTFFSKPSNPKALAIFRILFGLVLFYEFEHLKDLLTRLQYSSFFIKYDFFHWTSLPSQNIIDFLYPVTILLCIFFTLGFFFRLSSIILFIIYTYAFFIDKGHYNNHYYLYCIILFFFCITQSNKAFSLDSKIPFFKTSKNNFIQNWQYLLFQFQFFLVYFFGGIAKIHGDWLQGYPLRYWLYENSFKFEGFFNTFYKQEHTAYVYSYAGLFFDLSVGFLLLHKKFRWYALIPIIFFHVSNVFLWNIGSFPYAMIFALIVFFHDKFKFKPKILEDDQTKLKSKLIIKLFFLTWFSFQILFPFRQYLFKGNPSFNGQGHLFAWRMMLVDNLDALRIKVIIPNTTDEFYVDPLQYMNFWQFRKMSRTPIKYLSFCHFIRDEIKRNSGIENPIIKMEVYKSINGRTPVLLNDTSLNYANIDYNPLKTQTWINDWSEKDEKPSFSIEKYDRWIEVVKSSQ